MNSKKNSGSLTSTVFNHIYIYIYLGILIDICTVIGISESEISFEANGLRRVDSIVLA